MVAVDLPPEITTSFVAEARSYLPLILEGLVAVKDHERLSEAYRFAHTIKSSAAMMGHDSLSQIAELLEGDLEAIMLGEPADAAWLAQLGRSVTRIGRLLDAVAGAALDVESIVADEVADRMPLTPSPSPTRGEGDEPVRPAAPTGEGDELESLAAPTGEGDELESLAASTGEGDEPVRPAASIAEGEANESDWQATLEASEATHLNTTAVPARAEEPDQTAKAEFTADQVTTTHEFLPPTGTTPPQPRADVPPFRVGKGDRGLGHPPALAPDLVDELAETVLALGRDVAAGNDAAAVHEHLRAIAGWLAKLGAGSAVGGDGSDGTPEPDAREPAVQAAALAPDVVELNPAHRAESAGDSVASEAALRRTLEAELRFQIEEEVRAALAAAPSVPQRAAPAATLAPDVPLQRTAAAQAHPIRRAVAPDAAGSDAAAGAPGVPVDPELLEVFAAEAGEHLKRIDADLAALEASPGSTDVLRSLRRSIHTLKGAAAMMGSDAVAALAHTLEDRLDAAIDAPGGLEPAAYATFLRDIDQLERLIVRADAVDPAAAAGPNAGLAQSAAEATAQAGAPALAATPPPVAAADAASATVPVRLEQLDELLRLAGEASVSVASWRPLLAAAANALDESRRALARIHALRAEVEARGAGRALDMPRGHGQDERPLDRLRAGWTRDEIAAPDARHSPLAIRHSSESEFDPLELDCYTPADHVARELAETAAEALTAERELSATLESAADLATNQRHQAAAMQDRLLAVRLVPLEDLAGRLQRAVRGIALRRDRDVSLSFAGGEVAVDRAILDPIADALIHLVRNAVDHGIEPRAVRAAGGKPQTGHVQISARQEQGEVVVEVGDDGAGIDARRVVESARQRGLLGGALGVDGAERPDDALGVSGAAELQRAVEIMFEAGLSTAEQVDDISGRGVGLDAVRAAIARVRGAIAVTSEPGAGTTFTLRFPVTLAQARVVMAEAAGNPVAIPAMHVKRIARLGEIETQRLGDHSIARLDGSAYPVADLAATLGLEFAGRLPVNPPVLFVDAGGRRAALVAGGVGTHQEVVIKPIGTHLQALRGVAGATMLQDGRVSLLLHLPDLLAWDLPPAGQTAELAFQGPARPRTVAEQPVVEALEVLIVDDSPTIRKLLVRTLKDLGWQAREAKDGAEALESIRMRCPDVVLADIEMPRLDGYGLLAALRSRSATANLPVLMLTSRTAEKHRRRAMELGADGYLTKPYRPADVVAALRGVTRRAHTEAVARS